MIPSATLPDWTDPARKMLAAETVRVGDLLMTLHPADNWTEYKLWSDRRSPEHLSMAAFLAAIADRPALICDIGANCGSYTVMLAARMAKGSTLLAFEPNPVMADRLRTNLALNNLSDAVTLHPCALGDAPGRATLSLHAQNLGQSTLRVISTDVAGVIEVEVATLAGFVASAPPYQVFALKIDVEGFEDRILLPFFAATPAELWPDILLIEVEHADQWASDLGATLKSLGYHTTFADEGNALMLRARPLPH